MTTTRPNQTTGLTNGRAANWVPEVAFSPFRVLSRRQLTFPFCCLISLVIWERELGNLKHRNFLRVTLGGLCAQTQITVRLFCEFRCTVGDWKLTKMAACKLHFSFSKICGDYLDGFSRRNQKQCRK